MQGVRLYKLVMYQRSEGRVGRIDWLYLDRSVSLLGHGFIFGHRNIVECMEKQEVLDTMDHRH
jgi:hypothetical protein